MITKYPTYVHYRLNQKRDKRKTAMANYRMAETKDSIKCIRIKSKKTFRIEITITLQNIMNGNKIFNICTL